LPDVLTFSARSSELHNLIRRRKKKEKRGKVKSSKEEKKREGKILCDAPFDFWNPNHRGFYLPSFFLLFFFDFFLKKVIYCNFIPAR
jgi:hypothetical protein